MYERHIARIGVAPELVAKALHFPEGTEIIAASVERGAHGFVLGFVVEHPDLPEVDEGDLAPEIYPIVTYHRESWDFDWNVPQVSYTVTYDDQDQAEMPHPEELADEEALNADG